MIDIFKIEDALVRSAQEAVGEYLSLTGTESHSEPSVIIARPNITVPAFPYIVLSLLEVRDTYGINLREVVEDGQPTYYINKTYHFQFTIKGSDSESPFTAAHIADKLRTYLRLPHITHRIFESSCVELQETFPVLDASEQVAAQDYVEAAFFTVTFAGWDTLTPKRPEDSVGVIDTIALNGHLYRETDDPNPIPVDIAATSRQ